MKKLPILILVLLINFVVFGAEVVDHSVVVTGTSAVIHWTTDVATGTRAEIKPSGPKVESSAGKATSTDHEVSISKLRPGVSYTVTYGTARLWLGTNIVSADDGKTPALTKSAATTPFVPSVPKAASRTLEKQAAESAPPPTRKIWGNMASLPDHFERHGPDFGAKSQDEYAQMSWRFLQRAKTEGLPAKLDEEGILRVFDPKSGTFASYNPDGTTKTFFKPGSNDYFERQPGKSVNLKTSSKSPK